MTKELIERLRDESYDNEAMNEAADEIERLLAEVSGFHRLFHAASFISRHSSNESWREFVAAYIALGGYDAAVADRQARDEDGREK